MGCRPLSRRKRESRSARRPRAQLADAAALSARISTPQRHDRHRHELRGSLPRLYRRRGGRHSRAPPDGPDRSRRRRLHGPRGKGARGRRRDSAGAGHWQSGAHRHVDRGGIGEPRGTSEDRWCHVRGVEREKRCRGGRDSRPGRCAWRGHDRDQHGGQRHRREAGRRRRNASWPAGRPVRDWHEPPRKPASGFAASRPRRASGRSGRVALSSSASRTT